MPNLKNVERASDGTWWTGWSVLVDSARMAVAAVVSVLVAQLVRLPETHWGSARWRDCGELLRTASACVRYCVFVLGLLCAVLRSDRTAYRFGAVTLAIVLLIPRTGLARQIAFHRFAEVSTGIAVALISTVVWPEREIAPSEGKPNPSVRIAAEASLVLGQTAKDGDLRPRKK